MQCCIRLLLCSTSSLFMGGESSTGLAKVLFFSIRIKHRKNQPENYKENNTKKNPQHANADVKPMINLVVFL
uniref:Secreted protein n=1 Tax=Anguilla anguilla TaxID=7936 RepID=A0A0E9S230_ANGAN